MKSFRFSLRSMLLGVAAVSLACAALVKPNWIWVLTLQAASLGILTVALLAALVYERGAARAFWIGFAVVGWGNLGLQRLQLTEVSLTSVISEWLLKVVHPFPPLSASPPPIDPAAEQPLYANSTQAASPAEVEVQKARDAFPYLVIWIWPPLIGLVGGVVAQQLYLRRERLVD